MGRRKINLQKFKSSFQIVFQNLTKIIHGYLALANIFEYGPKYILTSVTGIWPALCDQI